MNSIDSLSDSINYAEQLYLFVFVLCKSFPSLEVNPVPKWNYRSPGIKKKKKIMLLILHVL